MITEAVHVVRSADGESARVVRIADGVSSADLAASLAAERAAAADSYVSLTKAIGLSRVTEGVPIYSYMDSYGNNFAGVAGDIAAAFPFRVAARLRTQAIVDRSVSHTRSDQIQAKVISTWTAPGRGLILTDGGAINDATQASSTATSREAFRGMLAYLSAQYVAPITDASIEFGPGWTAGLSDGTAGRYVDIAFTGDKCDILYAAVTGSGGSFTITDSTNTVIKTVAATGGFSFAFTGAARISGFGSGNHTVRVKVASGAVTIAGSIVPQANPPVIAWFQPGPILFSSGSFNTAIAACITAQATVLADFPNVVPVPVDGNWDNTTMQVSDLTHLNDKGNAYVADLITAALASRAYAQGLNMISAAVTYTAPAPAFDTSGATAPSAPTTVTATAGNQVNGTFVRAGDGGATITAQPVQASSDSGTTWVTVLADAGATASTYNITAGLTQGTSYIVRVGATNAHGTTYSAASSGAVAGAVPAVYSADPLTGTAGSAMGTAATGGQTWVESGTSVHQRQPDGIITTTIGTSGTNDVQVDDSHSDGTFQLTIVTIGTLGQGIAFDNNSGHTTGYLFYVTPTGWWFYRRTALGTFAQQLTGSTTVASGDVLKVIKNGSSIKCYVNATKFVDTTDATYSGTSHGPFVWSQGTVKLANWLHNSLTS